MSGQLGQDSCHDADGDVTPDQAAAGYLGTLRLDKPYPPRSKALFHLYR